MQICEAFHIFDIENNLMVARLGGVLGEKEEGINKYKFVVTK